MVPSWSKTDVWKWHNPLREAIKKPTVLKQNDIYAIFSLRKFCVRETALKAKMTVVSLVESSLTAEIRCYATRISKVFAAPGSHFNVCLHRLGRNWWLLIMLFFSEASHLKALCRRRCGTLSLHIIQDIINSSLLLHFSITFDSSRNMQRCSVTAAHSYSHYWMLDAPRSSAGIAQ